MVRLLYFRPGEIGPLPNDRGRDFALDEERAMAALASPKIARPTTAWRCCLENRRRIRAMTTARFGTTWTSRAPSAVSPNTSGYIRVGELEENRAALRDSESPW
jgi:hypothetical protein